MSPAIVRTFGLLLPNCQGWKPSMPADELRIVSINGCLGYGYQGRSLDAGIAARPHLVGGDAGSTDPGPYYLGSGTSLVKDEQIHRDLAPALLKSRAANVPLVI